MSNSLHEGLQDVVASVPDALQPIIVAALGAIPYVEGEGAAALGIVAGLHPVLAAVAGAAGNLLAVVLLVLLSSRVREAVAARRRPRPDAATGTATAVLDGAPDAAGEGGAWSARAAKGRSRLAAWTTRFGVPGASLIAPLAVPTHLAAVFFVASGVSKRWVVLWQAVAIVLWTGVVAVVALGALGLLGWR